MSKLPHVGTTIFTVMSKMANDFGAINLAQGFPNFTIDEKLNNLVKTEAASLIHQYAPMPGSMNLRQAIAEMNLDTYGVKFSVDEEILVTAGATQAIFTTIQALVNIGDEVVQLDPSYDCYEPAVTLAGGKSIRINLNDEFRPDWNKINEATNHKTRLLIINNPHNPMGTLWSRDDFNALETLCEKYPDLLILSDEVYECITFEKEFISIKSIESLRDRAICVSSFGKTFHITGWKIGYLIAPEKWMIEIKKVHQFLVFSVNSIAQEVIAKYIKIADYVKIKSLYQNKRDLFAQAMANSRFKMLPCEGSFFQIAEYSEISKGKDTEFVKDLVKDFGVATIPTSVFYQDDPDQQIIRFCFAKEDKTLIQAAEKLCKI
ncbi:MAG: methionine aminotransferase [Crocinitomicaceae bacterium]|jgi:methionine aminotransferase|nr:methionine aminotransferase [Crocinitomicaceae bacterium]MDG2464856.1 methionine aminotransferase [Crocinitomicaceae bacterium]